MRGMPWKDEAGLTLVEILVAVALIMIGLVALMQWFPLGTQGMETGRKQSTAVFLAEQQVEQIKAWALSTTAPQGWANPPLTPFQPCNPCNPCVNPCPTNTPFVSPTFGAIPGYPEYSRTVILAAGPTATTLLVRVQVDFRRVTEVGVFTSAAAGANQVELATIIAQH